MSAIKLVWLDHVKKDFVGSFTKILFKYSE